MPTLYLLNLLMVKIWSHPFVYLNHVRMEVYLITHNPFSVPIARYPMDVLLCIKSGYDFIVRSSLFAISCIMYTYSIVKIRVGVYRLN